MRRAYVEYVDGEALSVEEPPYKAIFLAFLLLFIGTCLLALGLAIVFDHIDAHKHWPEAGKSQAIGILVLGTLTFIPGSYVSHLAYKAYYGSPGYSFSQIPVVGHED